MGAPEVEGSSRRAVQIPNLLIHDHGPRVGCGCLYGPASELRQEALQRSNASTKRSIFCIASLQDQGIEDPLGRLKLSRISKCEHGRLTGGHAGN